MRSNCGSLQHDVLYVGIWTLQVGHSWLHLCKLSFMHLPQKRWLHSGLTSVSVQDSKQMAHSNSSSRNFLRDAWTEDNVKNMMRRRWRWCCGNGMCFVDWLKLIGCLVFGLFCWWLSVSYIIRWYLVWYHTTLNIQKYARFVVNAGGLCSIILASIQYQYVH